MRHGKVGYLPILLLALLPSSCETSGGAGAWTVTVDTLPSGAAHVVNIPPGHDAGPTWIIEEELRIGSLEDEGPVSFAEIKGLVVTEAGHIAILDSQSQEVRVFGDTGEHLVTFGGKGGGPGEFETAWGLMRAPDGKLWVPDHRNARMSVLDLEGGFEESFPLHVLSRSFVWRGAMTVDGHILKPSITLGSPRRDVLRVYDQEMTLLDSLPMPERPPYDPKDPPGAFYWEAPGGSAMGYMGVPYYPQRQNLLDPRGGIWSREAGDYSYRIKHWEPAGDTALVLETQRFPVPISPAERDSVIEGVRLQLQERGDARQDWSKVPETRAAVTSMFLTEEGRLWVQTASPDTLNSYDIYERSGSYVGTVISSLSPIQWIPPIVRGDLFWAVVVDEFDVPYVVRARIIPA